MPDSLGYVQTRAGREFGWHTHPYDELCLIADTPTTIGHAGEHTSAAIDTLYLFKAGERHGYWNNAKQSPRLWVIHYHGDDALEAAVPMAQMSPARRVWQLTAEQAEIFKAMHVRISVEQSLPHVGAEAAQSAWLQLLLIAIIRWSAKMPADITPRLIDVELQHMWQILHDYTGEPAGLVATLKQKIANYDSLRHRFKDMVGDSPARMWRRLRMHQAKNLLLESSLSVKEIAGRAGYARQHEFARAFKKQMGVSPTGWRKGVSHTF